MSDAGLQHFLGSTVINRQGLLKLRHSDVSHHAVTVNIEQTIVFLVRGCGIDGTGKSVGLSRIVLGELFVIGVRSIQHLLVLFLAQCFNAGVVVIYGAAGVAHNEEVADRRIEQNEHSTENDQYGQDVAQSFHRAFFSRGNRVVGVAGVCPSRPKHGHARQAFLRLRVQATPSAMTSTPITVKAMVPMPPVPGRTTPGLFWTGMTPFDAVWS